MNAQEIFVTAMTELQGSASFHPNRHGHYAYMDLPRLLQTVHAVWHRHGIVMTMDQGPDHIEIRLHIQTDTAVSVMDFHQHIPPFELFAAGRKGDLLQHYGSYRTYCRRYALYCMLGIHPAEDWDGLDREPATPPATRQPAPAPQQPDGPRWGFNDDDYLFHCVGKFEDNITSQREFYKAAMAVLKRHSPESRQAIARNNEAVFLSLPEQGCKDLFAAAGMEVPDTP